MVKKVKRGAVLRREDAPFSSLTQYGLTEPAVVAAVLVPALVARRAVALASATIDFLLVFRVPGRATSLTG